MVGGTVCETLLLPDRVWINVVDRTYGEDHCALYVERTRVAEKVKAGDALWWQGRCAMWTPQGAQSLDIEIPRLGYSGAKHPAAALIEGAFGS